MRAGALFCFALLTTVPTAAFPAHVVSCHNGDTCIAETGQGTVRIRLAEIDTPEIDQLYCTAARDFLYAMVCGIDVEDESRWTSYERIVGLIRVDDLDTIEAMNRVGVAWDYARYDSDPVMTGLKTTALQRGRGAWAAPFSIIPWNWRDRVKPR